MTLLIEATVTSNGGYCECGGGVAGVSVGSPFDWGMTARGFSPERPSASLGKSSSAAPIMSSGLS